MILILTSKHFCLFKFNLQRSFHLDSLQPGCDGPQHEHWQVTFVVCYQWLGTALLNNLNIFLWRFHTYDLLTFLTGSRPGIETEWGGGSSGWESYCYAGWPVGFYRISTTKQKTRISTKYRPHSTLSTKYRPQNFLKKRILSKLNCPWCNMMCHVLRFICMLSKGCHPVWFVVVCCSFDWDWANL